MRFYPDVSRKDMQYMQLCIEASKIFSTCAKRKYAAVLVDDLDHIVGMGYNGGPRNSAHCEDGGCPRLIENSENGSNYDNCIAIHAEANALLHSDYSSRAKKIYVNGPPCYSCAKLIANSTVSTIYYIADNSYKQWEDVKNFLRQNNVEVIQIQNASIKA
jgi:dCMP deaminase